MLAPTHAMFSLFLTLTILALFGIQFSLHWTVLTCAIFGSLIADIDTPKSLIADIDTPKSLIGQCVPFISKPLERRFHHRAVTHSLIGAGIASLIFAILIGIASQIPTTAQYMEPGLAVRWIAAFGIGYVSHLLLDMVNRRGIQLFWPSQTRDVFIKNPKFRPESGDKIELVVFLILFLFTLLSLPLSKYGITTSLRWLLATPEATIEEYKNLKTKLIIEFSGTVRSTQDHIKGTAEVLEVENKKLVVRVTDPKMEPVVLTLSDELAADITASRVRFKNTETPVRVEVRKFKNKSQTELFGKMPPGTLISGTIQLPKNLPIKIPSDLANIWSTVKPIQQKDDRLILTFASPDQIRSLQLDDTFELQLKQETLTRKQIQTRIARIHRDLAQLQVDDGLTPLGRQILMKPGELAKQDQRIQELKDQLEDLKLQNDGLNLTGRSHQLVFSGQVTIRY